MLCDLLQMSVSCSALLCSSSSSFFFFEKINSISIKLKVCVCVGFLTKEGNVGETSESDRGGGG